MTTFQIVFHCFMADLARGWNEVKSHCYADIISIHQDGSEWGMGNGKITRNAVHMYIHCRPID